METSLREAPALGQSGLIPVPMASVPTERISHAAATELPTEPDVIEKGVLVAKSTLAGLCLTAFACGIVTTIAIGHGHAPSSVAEVARVQEPVAAPAPATPAPAEVPAAAPAPADPVVVQMAGTPAAEIEPAVDKAPAAHVVAARTPRPPVTRTAPARRRATTDAPATGADAPGASAPAPAKWVDPFAE